MFDCKKEKKGGGGVGGLEKRVEGEKKKGIRFNNRFSSATGNSSRVEVETQKMAGR